jgi:hypothetical protein
MGMKSKRPNRGLRLRNAILASFFDPADKVAQSLEPYSERDWRKALTWLDMSGLALYLLDRLATLGVEARLPLSILDRLEVNLAENRKRTDALFHEAVVICQALTKENISFALLKGFTLPPEVLPDPVLRCQADIDILIRESDAIAARNIVLGFGYLHDSIKGAEWAFTSGTDKPMRMKSLYKVRPQKMVELHLLPAGWDGALPGAKDRLARAQMRSFHGIELPVLLPADIFVQQAVHVFRHLCSENTRAAWLLEYWRHVEARRGDSAFWRETRSIAEKEPMAEVAIGAVTLMSAQLFGQSAPQALTCWSVDRLSPTVRLWIELYGRRILVADPSGNKFYLFLKRQIHAGAGAPQALWYRSLLPFHWWPERITHGKSGEHLDARLVRYRIEAGFVLARLRFHIRTCIPFVLESRRWKRMTDSGE